MFRSLYAKIAAGLAALFLLIGLVFIGITVFSTDMYHQEINQKLNIGLAEQIVKERILMSEGQVNKEALKEIFHMLMVINPSIEIYLLDPQGDILTYSAPQGSVKRESVDLRPVKKWLSKKTEAPIQGDDPKSLDRKKVFSAAPIVRNGELEGYLYVILGGVQFDSIAQKIKGSYILQLSGWMTLSGVIFTLTAGLLLFGLLTGRLRKLARLMDSFKPGFPLETEMPTGEKTDESSDEIDRLSSIFREMASRIESQMQALKSTDNMRRELVANVSHDLRTPLATLQGYIETLLIKDDQYSRQEREEYLKIAIKHCQRLNRLVKDLLELAKLESTQISITKEPFHLLELVQDVIQKFMLQAKEKNIQLRIDTKASQPFVEADIALIERVLENLIENAIHYTPENGIVSIQVAGTAQLVTVDVKDTGIGIPQEELPHIFDRFYQSKHNRKDRKHHSGLGLAIAYKIIEHHQQKINVVSTLEKGTCFSFSLPLAESL